MRGDLARAFVLMALLAASCATTQTDNRVSGDWVIRAFWDGQAMVQSNSVFGSPGWVRFDDGEIEGTPGCGALTGQYTATATRVEIQATAIVAGSCLRRERGMSVDEWPMSLAVLNALNGVARSDVRGTEMILQDANGVPLLVLASR